MTPSSLLLCCAQGAVRKIPLLPTVPRLSSRPPTMNRAPAEWAAGLLNGGGNSPVHGVGPVQRAVGAAGGARRPCDLPARKWVVTTGASESILSIRGSLTLPID